MVRAAAEKCSGNKVRFLVDASKDPYRLLWMAASDCFDLHVIHLVKDPRAFVHSMTRSEDRPRRRVARFTARWIIENALMHRLVNQAFSGRSKTILYEDLASDPIGVMDKIGSWLGIEYTPEIVGAFRQVENHAVSGNKMRWSDAPIALDERWKAHISAWLATAIWQFSWPTRRIIGMRTPYVDRLTLTGSSEG